MNSDDRIMARKELVFYLEVFNTETEDNVGRLVDMTTRGCKVVARDGIESGVEMPLSIVLPDERYGEEQLHFNAIARWSTADVNPDYIVTGFEIIRLGARERKIVRKLMDTFGFIGEIGTSTSV